MDLSKLTDDKTGIKTDTNHAVMLALAGLGKWTVAFCAPSFKIASILT